MSPPPFITRVRIQNYASIKACDVTLGPLAILVGPNGSGKSNFLDALRFTSDALATTLDLALRDRGRCRRGARRSEQLRQALARDRAPREADGG